jgi:hypothetical protein
MSETDLAFYCVADSRYFLGAVGMLNSLRLVGHKEPVYVLDCGLEPRQRELLAREATLVEAPNDAPPWLLKTVAPLRHPARVMVLIDADIIVTRSLTDLAERAADSRVIAVENDKQRFVPQWADLLGLPPIRRQTYVSSGLVVAGQPIGRETLTQMSELQGRVDFDQSFWRANVADYPFLYGDQDVLNAILASTIPRDQVIALEYRLAPNPPFTGLRLLDTEDLRCAHRDGSEPYALHHFYRKPWLVRTRSSPYSRLLGRVLLGPDAALRVDAKEVPLRLRPGLRGTLARVAVDIVVGVPGYVHRRVKPGPRGWRGWADPRWRERGSDQAPSASSGDV